MSKSRKIWFVMGVFNDLRARNNNNSKRSISCIDKGVHNPPPVTRQVHSNFLLEKLDINIIQLYMEILVSFIPDKHFNIKYLGTIFM